MAGLTRQEAQQARLFIFWSVVLGAAMPGIILVVAWVAGAVL